MLLIFACIIHYCKNLKHTVAVPIANNTRCKRHVIMTLLWIIHIYKFIAMTT